MVLRVKGQDKKVLAGQKLKVWINNVKNLVVTEINLRNSENNIIYILKLIKQGMGSQKVKVNPANGQMLRVCKTAPSVRV